MIDQFGDIRRLDPAIMPGAGLAPVPGASAAGIELRIHQRAVPFDAEMAPAAIGDARRLLIINGHGEKSSRDRQSLRSVSRSSQGCSIRCELFRVRRQTKEALPQVVPAGGLVILRDGEPGEPDVTLNPRSEFYSHRTEIEAFITPAVSGGGEATLDALLTEIGAALAADRSLGG